MFIILVLTRKFLLFNSRLHFCNVLNLHFRHRPYTISCCKKIIHDHFVSMLQLSMQKWFKLNNCKTFLIYSNKVFSFLQRLKCSYVISTGNKPGGDGHQPIKMQLLTIRMRYCHFWMYALKNLMLHWGCSIRDVWVHDT